MDLDNIVSKEIHHQKYYPILLRDTQLTLKALLELGASEDDKSLYLESRLYHLVEFSLGKLTLAAVTSEVEKSPEKIDQIEYDKIKSNIDRELNGSRHTF
ncbi:MAG: hypothetical protein NT027_09455 [Proteobacteria bacterium]|nr:hypothetical protein [Pseudomonadota bacterium]